MSKDLECPYCEEELEICHDDGFGYEEDVEHEMQCGNCEKNFVFTTSIMFYYMGYKADCLNEGNHIYEPTPTAPKKYTKMRCKTCSEKRDPTPEEREKYGIPPIT